MLCRTKNDCRKKCFADIIPLPYYAAPLKKDDETNMDSPFMNNTRHAEQGSVRAVLLVLVSFSLGVAATALWFHRPPGGNVTNAVSQTTVPPPADEQPAQPPSAPPEPPRVVSPPPSNPVIIEEVKKQVPNYATISLEDGENILRLEALDEFRAAAAKMNDQIKAAQQQLQDAQNGQSAEKQQAAMKNLQDMQLTATEKLKEIAARLQAQITALQSLKSQP